MVHRDKRLLRYWLAVYPKMLGQAVTVKAKDYLVSDKTLINQITLVIRFPPSWYFPLRVYTEGHFKTL